MFIVSGRCKFENIKDYEFGESEGWTRQAESKVHIQIGVAATYHVVC